MTDHSVAQARNDLSRLIDRAVRGETVVITRHGRPMVRLTPVDPPRTPLWASGAEMAAWLKAHQVVAGTPFKESGAALVSRMRDEDTR